MRRLAGEKQVAGNGKQRVTRAVKKLQAEAEAQESAPATPAPRPFVAAQKSAVDDLDAGQRHALRSFAKRVIALGDPAVGELDLISNLRIHDLLNAISEAKKPPLVWQDMRDHCLANTSNITEVQQRMLACIGSKGEPSPADIDKLTHIYNNVTWKTAS